MFLCTVSQVSHAFTWSQAGQSSGEPKEKADNSHMVCWNIPPKLLYWLVVSNIFVIFHNIWDNPSHWPIFFKMVKTTNQCTSMICFWLLLYVFSLIRYWILNINFTTLHIILYRRTSKILRRYNWVDVWDVQLYLAETCPGLFGNRRLQKRGMLSKPS